VGKKIVSRASSRKPDGKIQVNQKPLCDLTEEALTSYFEMLNGHQPNALYELVIGEVEKPLLRTVLDYAEGNQSLAADILGINRGTLRKKLRQHGLVN